MAFKLKFTLLPTDYVAPAGSDIYMKMAKAGSPIKFVIAGTIVPGYSYWTNSKAKIRSRVPFTETPDIKIEDGKTDRVSHFWCMPVFDTETETVRILEITQSTLQNQLQGIFDGGDYDLSDLSNPMAIKITASGEKLLTKYTLMPVPVNNPKMISILEASDLLEPGAVDKLIYTTPATPATEKIENPGAPTLSATAAKDIM